MPTTFFSSLLPALTNRTKHATISKLGFSNQPLRKHLMEVFDRSHGQEGSFLGEPVFEATFGWCQATETLESLAPGLLHSDVIEVLDKPWHAESEKAEKRDTYRLARDLHPYTHQLEAWQSLLGPGYQSVVVTSGTGSGKTECFMVPVISQLAQARASEGSVQGVRALFLYPLNALIKSQRDRLRAWTGGFNGDIRFCLYNGMTPDEAPADESREAPNEIHDRATLRRTPPAILVTNPTMLEYMLVRAQDAPILAQSKGKLEWIVLDEAHNYIGSQAAELALLLRRVLHAFGTEANRVRFVATSATIGSDDDATRIRLQEFLARLAGVDASLVTVVGGQRAVPELRESAPSAGQPAGLSELVEEPTSEGLYRRLSTHAVARRLRDLFVPTVSKQSYQPLSAVQDVLNNSRLAAGEIDALKWLDVLTDATSGDGRNAIPFLPLRLHAFHNTLAGLWACANPSCTAKAGTALTDAAWPFGLVHTTERRHCSCGAPVYPIISCNDCNETYLSADLRWSQQVECLLPPIQEDIDEFTLDRDPEEADPRDEEVDGYAEAEAAYEHRSRVLIVNSALAGAAFVLNPASLERTKPSAEGAITLRIQDVTLVGQDFVLQCPACKGGVQGVEQFRRPMLGAPYLLGNILPTLLEHCPDGEHPLESPLRGRRMITFTDSRQGTARIAAQLQQDAERNALRSAVYKKTVLKASSPDPMTASLATEVDALKGVLAGIPTSLPAHKNLRDQIEAKEAQLALTERAKATSFSDLRAWLAGQVPDISNWIYRYYAEADEHFKGGRGKELLADILLCREFARRPKRQNSLETMGLVSVQYPKLTAVKTLRSAPHQAGFTMDEWVSFLKICLDFFVRQSLCLELPSSWERWGATRVYSKQLLMPGSLERSSSRLVKWPKVRPGPRQHRLVRLLACVLERDPATDLGRHLIDALLLDAWKDLTETTDLLRVGGGQGRALSREDFSFKVMSGGWMCPVTRRILDVTLRGVTPYLPEHPSSDAVTRCMPVQIPVCDVYRQDLDSEQLVLAARGWIEKQEDVLNESRIQGLWSNLHDRIIEGIGYFRAVEHSAQQVGKRLDNYEKEFKRGAINLMSCSTTMEMGVDIGGINMVAMNNVPPHPANYLQRAGRAGRRAETRSVALTICKNNPHDQHVFSNTIWPFTTQIPVPKLSFNSPSLIQRHVNAVMLSAFLRTQDRRGKLDKLTMDWWMLPEGERKSRQEQFVAWCQNLDPRQQDEVERGLQALIRRTVLEGGDTPETLAAKVATAITLHAEAWRAELKAIDEQVQALSTKADGDRVPLKALQAQRKRLVNEYLLRELATSGFLPGYGFPTDITTFETLNKDSTELTRMREGREDNRFQRRELPSRDTVTALREYAPGASVVIDGLVYESAGITLNWHVPASENAVNELQNIRRAWRCGHCGASGTTVLADPLSVCPDCGFKIIFDSRHSKTYLEPAGFSVDLYAETHNDITYQRYVPVQPPWISARGDWIPLSSGALGAFRASSEGSVLHHSSGSGGKGYAVCLECGRSAPLETIDGEETTLPAVFRKPHARLRGRAAQSQSWECGGSASPFKIKRGISFGREYTTDVLELILVGLDGHPLNDRVVAYSLAVALRAAVASHLGIDETELGCDTKAIRDTHGRRAEALVLYDVRSGGYASIVLPELPSLLRKARAALHCVSGCQDACQKCLLTYDTRFNIDHLDRHAALSFLTEDWLQALQLPEEQQLFGDQSCADYQPLAEAITRELNRSNARSLAIYLNGDVAEWDLPSSPMRRLLHRLSVKSGIKLALVSSQQDLSTLSMENASVLSSLQSVCGVKLVVGRAPKLSTPGAALATVQLTDATCISWAIGDIAAALPNDAWALLDQAPLVTGPTEAPEFLAEAVRLPEARGQSMHVLEVTNELDGPGSGFGQKFWATVIGKGGDTLLPPDQSVVEITYSDRYLVTPISCALLVDVISALKVIYEPLDQWLDPTIVVETMDIEPSVRRNQSLWTSNWPSTEMRNDAQQEAFAYCGLTCNVKSGSRQQIRHCRELRIQFDSGPDLIVWFDAGLGYWSVPRADPRIDFPCDEPAQVLGQRLAEIDVTVSGHALPTMIFLGRDVDQTCENPPQKGGFL